MKSRRVKRSKRSKSKRKNRRIKKSKSRKNALRSRNKSKKMTSSQKMDRAARKWVERQKNARIDENIRRQDEADRELVSLWYPSLSSSERTN